MSHTVRSKAKITNHAELMEAIRQQQAENQDIQVVVDTASRVEVKLPGWSQTVKFLLDQDGRVEYDNYSRFTHDHPDVISGKRRAGEEGKWGNLVELDKLTSRYFSINAPEAASSFGHLVSENLFNPETGVRKLVIELPDELQVG